MKITVKGNNPITGDDIKYVFDKLNEEYKHLGVQIKNTTCYVRFALENGEGKNVEIKGVPEQTFVFTEEVQNSSNASDGCKEKTPFGSKISVYKTALKNNNNCELCDYCVSRRGGKASKVKFNEAELKRVLNVLLKENGFEFEMYNIYFNSEDEETIYSLLNKCNRTVFFYIYRNEGVGKYRACMEMPNEGCHTIWIEPCQNKKINSFRGEYSFLSNFYEAPVEYEGLTYQSSEAAYQAQKCADPKDREAFTAMNPAEAKKAGRTVTIREDWEDVKISVMTGIVRAKFEQNPDLAGMLLATKDAYLEEGNNWGDRVWGTVNGEGANNLGLILMDTRKFLSK